MCYFKFILCLSVRLSLCLFVYCEHELHNNNKKAVLSQRWPRDARYISRSWAVADIWPFEIIQDGGRRDLKFVQIENSAIRDPPSPKTPP